MDETELLNHIAARSAALRDYSQVALGPGDDCALVSPPDLPHPPTALSAALSRGTLATVDQLIEGRHFLPGTPLKAIAHKAIARSISDIAAMAGTPTAALCTGALPMGYPQADALFDALHRAGISMGCPLVGGDIAFYDGPLALTVTVLGVPHTDRGAVLRSGASAEELVVVSGEIGGSFETGHHLEFSPRAELAIALASELGPALTAMIDISDGLGLDAARLAKASGVRIELRGSAIPLRVPGRSVVKACADGEDYELLFTCHSDSQERLQRVAQAIGVPVTVIGFTTAGSGCILIEDDGTTHDAATLGWVHSSPSDSEQGRGDTNKPSPQSGDE